MDEAAFARYAAERSNWLKQGRCRLLRSMLHQASLPLNAEILEVGSGVGQNIPTLAEFGRVDAMEINPLGLAQLRATNGVRQIFDQPIPCTLDTAYDAIVAMDVIEHIEDDRAALEWISTHLRPGGVLFATVPAYQWLFSGHDVALGHFRRYAAGLFRSALPPRLRVLRCGYFDMTLFPIAAGSRLLSRKREKQSSSVPSHIDSIFLAILRGEVAVISSLGGLPFGLSVYCLARLDG